MLILPAGRGVAVDGFIDALLVVDGLVDCLVDGLVDFLLNVDGLDDDHADDLSEDLHDALRS